MEIRCAYCQGNPIKSDDYVCPSCYVEYIGFYDFLEAAEMTVYDALDEIGADCAAEYLQDGDYVVFYDDAPGEIAEWLEGYDYLVFEDGEYREMASIIREHDFLVFEAGDEESMIDYLIDQGYLIKTD